MLVVNSCRYVPWVENTHPRLAVYGSEIRVWHRTLQVNLDDTVGLSRFAGPGGWNDPDILEARLAVHQTLLSL